jgi:hypothetical protein
MTCYICRKSEAGNDYAGSYSAYCGECQPRDTRPAQPKGSQCYCSPCERVLATVTDFERHQETYPKGHPLEGVFTGRCFDPATLGLELSGGVWGTPEGNANRTRKADRMASVRACRSMPLGQKMTASHGLSLRR